QAVKKAMRLPEKRNAEALALLVKGHRLYKAWKRWEAVIESGDIRQLRPPEPNPSCEAHALVGQLGRRMGA
ncbi:MAG TPA: hypothetical protein VGZ29_08010, partial [Terriglobia bacterium]|nr:hypothetical protein [Terriglobia bacterium]